MATSSTTNSLKRPAEAAPTGLGVPAQKRSRTPSPSAVPVLTPSITQKDLSIINLDASHKLILSLLAQVPATVPIVASCIDAELAKRQKAADVTLAAERRWATTMDFSRYARDIEEYTEEEPYRGQDMTEKAQDIFEIVEEGLKMMRLGIEEADTYESRRSAFSAMLSMVAALADCPYERLSDELYGFDEIEEGMQAVWKVMVQRCEAEKFREDSLQQLNWANDRYSSDSYLGHIKKMVRVALGETTLQEVNKGSL